MAKTTTAKRDAWLKTATGRKINPDHAFGFQCKDVIDDYGIKLYGKKLGVAVPLGNAATIFNRLHSNYWKKIKNDPKQPNQLPQKGDMIFWGAAAWNLWYGHCAVVVSADKNGVTVIQQDGILQTPAHRKRWSWNRLPQGWARPNYETVKPPVKKVYYTVKKNDNLSTIAAKQKMSLGRLLQLNPQIKNIDLINIGQKVRIK